MCFIARNFLRKEMQETRRQEVLISVPSERPCGLCESPHPSREELCGRRVARGADPTLRIHRFCERCEAFSLHRTGSVARLGDRCIIRSSSPSRI